MLELNGKLKHFKFFHLVFLWKVKLIPWCPFGPITPVNPVAPVHRKESINLRCNVQGETMLT